MSRLIDVDPQTQQESEPEGYEFGYYIFDSLPAMEVANMNTTKDKSINDEDKGLTEIHNIPLPDETLSQLQLQDAFCSHIITQIKKGNIKSGQLYILHDNILRRNITDNDKMYETIVLPRALTAQVLKMAHDDLGHNGTHRTYMLLKRLYYWKGLKPSVVCYIQRCYHCQRRNKQVVKYATLHFDVANLPNAIHLYGFDRGISSSHIQRKEICFNCYLYVNRICVLYPTKNQNH